MGLLGPQVPVGFHIGTALGAGDTEGIDDGEELGELLGGELLGGRLGASEGKKLLGAEEGNSEE